MGDNELLREIGSRVSARRRELRFTQEQLAERMEVSPQMISNLEKGKKAIRPENLLRLSEVLCISTDYILTGRRSEAETSDAFLRFSQLNARHQRIIEELIDSLIESGKE